MMWLSSVALNSFQMASRIYAQYGSFTTASHRTSH